MGGWRMGAVFHVGVPIRETGPVRNNGRAPRMRPVVEKAGKERFSLSGTMMLARIL